MSTAEVIEASQRFMSIANKLTVLSEFDEEQTLLLALLYQAEDDTWTPEEREELEQRLAEVSAGLLHKVGSYAHLIKRLEYDAGYEAAEIERLEARRKRKLRAADWLKGQLFDHVKRHPRQKVETGTVTLSIAKNPPRVEILEELMVPVSYLRIIPEKKEVNKQAVAAALKRGEEVPGAMLVQGERLSIS